MRFELYFNEKWYIIGTITKMSWENIDDYGTGYLYLELDREIGPLAYEILLEKEALQVPYYKRDEVLISLPDSIPPTCKFRIVGNETLYSYEISEEELSVEFICRTRV